MKINSTEMTTLLRQIHDMLEKQRSAARKNALYETDNFNPFRFFATHENGLSAVLAFLLNPEESHGQGRAFLDTFLRHIERDDFLSYDKVKVSQEKTLGSQRRHDIVIEGFMDKKTAWILSIENKLRDAADQKNQIKDYMQDLQGRNKEKHCLIYLPSSEERMPSEESVDKDSLDDYMTKNNLKVIDAEWLIDWLEKTPIVAPIMSQFVYFFIQFLRRDIMGETSETHALVDVIVQDKSMLDAALEILAAEHQLRNFLWNKLKKQLGEKCKEAYPNLAAKGWEIEDDFKPTSRYMWLGFSLKRNGKYYKSVAIEFASTNYHGCYYGAWLRNYKDSGDSIFIEKINQYQESEKSNKSKMWLFWKWLDGDLKDWEPSTWKRIQSGELAKEIFAKWEPLLDIFNDPASVKAAQE